MTSPDVVIVGGGVIGLACAWRAAERGMSVELFEANAIGSGATGAALGVLSPANVLQHRPLHILQRESLARYAEFCERLESQVPCGSLLEHRARLEVVADDNRRQVAVVEARRSDSVITWPTPRPSQEMLSTEDVAALEPAVRAPSGALLCRATRQVEPRRLLLALRMACVAAGVRVHEHTPVQEVVIEQDQALGVRVEDQVRAAGQVLVTTGWNTGGLGEVVATTAPVAAEKGQALVVRQPNLRLSMLLRRGPLYVFPRRSGEFVIGATTEPEAGGDLCATAAARRDLLAEAAEMVPGIESGDCLQHWAGARPAPADRRAYLGPVPEVSGLFVAVGHYKIGIALAPVTADALTDWMLEGGSEVSLEPFRTRPWTAASGTRTTSGG